SRCSRSVPVAVTLTAVTLPRSAQVFLEQQHRRGEPVEEAAITDGSELTGAEHAGGGAAGHVRVDDLGVVVGPAEQLDAAAVAREHQRALRLSAGEQLAQIDVGGRRVAYLELDGVADLHLVTDGDGAHLPIASDDVADEKIAAAEVDLVLV